MNLKQNLSVRLVKLMNAVWITVPFGFIWYMVYAQQLWKSPFYRNGNLAIIFLFLFLYWIMGRTFDAFSISMSPVSELVYSQMLAAFFSDVVMYVVICLLSRRLVTVIPVCLCLVAQFMISAVCLHLAHRWYFRKFPPKKTVIIYGQREGMEYVIKQYGMEKNFNVLACYKILDFLKRDMSETLDGMQIVFLSGVHSRDRNVILKYCVEHGISVMIIPRVGDVLMSGAKRLHLFHLPLLRVDRYCPAPEYVFLKRLFDIVVSGVTIILLSPVMLITAIAVKADGGPALYKQVRLTQNGKEFKILKFRSMRVDAEKDGVARLSSGDQDDRITKVGRIIRKIRFDELPQLFNILAGDMSIVGPRPERPEIARQYEETLPEFKLRLQAKAGLTGYAQVYGKYNSTPYDKLQMDLMYIANPSIIEDLKICLATVKILFLSESTEGIGAGQLTAMSGENSEQLKIG